MALSVGKPRTVPSRPPLLCLIAATAGAAGRRALLPGRQGTVLAAFRRSLYLASEDGALACLGDGSLGNGPLNLLLDDRGAAAWIERRVVPGLPYQSDGTTLRIGPHVTIDLSHLTSWHPPAVPPWTKRGLAAGLAAVAGHAALAAPAEGMGHLIPALVSGVRPSGRDDPFARAASAGVWALRNWLPAAIPDDARAGRQPTPEGVAGLIGLGPGLTPSGDDVIGGALIALRALDRGDVADRLGTWALPLARVRTGRISVAHLEAAADGQGVAALHDMLVELVTPGTPNLGDRLAAIGRVGHCSGWDGLAGVVCAAAALTEAT